ncbi:MAG TPA: tetratricopeptide repeat protein [Coleofasciculaceae cyanobacterium]|jgi:tetratricopeptide (TPR) repeat protein
MSQVSDRTGKQFHGWISGGLCLVWLGIAGIVVSASVFESIPPALAQMIPVAIQEAFTLLRQGRVMDAINAFEQALRRYPQSLTAKLGLAIAYRRQGLIPQAWQAYQDVLEQDPNNKLALKSIGVLGTYRSEWQVRGIEALTTLLNLTPNDTEARGLRALLYGYQQQFAEALADYQIVLQSNPTPDIVLGAAETYTNSGNPQQGLELFNRYQATGKAIIGYSAIAYARALRETGNPAQAVQVLETTLRASNKLDDLGIQTRAALSQAYLANQQLNEARAILVALQGRPEAILPLARSLNEIRTQTNDPTLSEQVANLYNQSLTTTPKPDPKLVREVADVFSSIPQQRQTALQLYQQLAASQPNDRSLLVKQLVLATQLGMISKPELRARLAMALQQLPTDAIKQRQLAQALVRIDPPGPEFLPVYQSLVAAGVNLPFLNFRIAQLLIEGNNLVGARTALAAYVTTPEGSRDLAPQLLAAEIERREGNLEASAQRYQGLITSNRADMDVLNAALRGLAGIRVAQSRPREAVALYDQLIARNPQDLTFQLARATIAYQAKLIPEAQAEAALNYWLQTQPATNAPSELFTLTGLLPPEPRREPLYNALVQLDPNNIPVQLRLLQVIAKRDPAQAKARVTQLVARDPNNLGNYLLQGQLAQGIDELDIASKAYQTVLSAMPYNLEALSALGGIRFQQRRFESASELYSQALALKPDDLAIRQSLASLKAVQDQQLEALTALEALQVEQIQRGAPSSDLSRQIQQIQEGFLQRRGFQPPWERY